MKILESFQMIDAFPKHRDEYRLRTTHGAVSSIIAVILMGYLFVSELSFYTRVETVDRLIVNSSHAEHIRVTFDLSFPHIPCKLLSIDTTDQAGQPQVGVKHHIMKKKIHPDTHEPIEKAKKGEKVSSLGTLKHEHELDHVEEERKERIKNEDDDDGHEDEDDDDEHLHLHKFENSNCGNCYGAEEDPDQCCNTCAQVQQAYVRRGWGFDPSVVIQCQKEHVETSFAEVGESGCNLYGDLDLTTVHGNFHFAPDKAMTQASKLGHMTVNELVAFTFQSFNVSHSIRALSFGNHFPGIESPLDDVTRHVLDGHGMHQYYIKVVPTKYQYLDGTTVQSNQYSVTEHLRHLDPGTGRGLPGVWFFYEISPVHAIFEEKTHSLLEFVASVCAILGGIFTIMGFVDNLMGVFLSKISPKSPHGQLL